ncbi:DUF6323 family protein [Anaerotruncus colihominis]|uniref:DUF6323 family protein n=1 Tax=Anaerotruncus colihominis TaxID=169435 RepID=UPI003514E660
MSGLLSLFGLHSAAPAQHEIEHLMQVNDVTRPYGLALTHEDAVTVLNAHTQALRGSGRIEIGAGAVDRLIEKFCDSPYINEENYVENICRLTELFYFMKSDALDRLTDDELLDQMKQAFDGCCEGSIDLLADRELDRIAYDIRAYGAKGALFEGPVSEQASSDYDVEEDGTWRTIRL